VQTGLWTGLTGDICLSCEGLVSAAQSWEQVRPKLNWNSIAARLLVCGRVDTLEPDRTDTK
jgi:hypothetical protein